MASFSSFATPLPDFNCESSRSSQEIFVRYEKGALSYDDGHNVEVRVNSISTDGKTLNLSGISKNLVFAGGGSQSVEVEVNMKSKKGKIIISTRTFYLQNVDTHKLNCHF